MFPSVEVKLIILIHILLSGGLQVFLKSCRGCPSIDRKSNSIQPNQVEGEGENLSVHNYTMYIVLPSHSRVPVHRRPPNALGGGGDHTVSCRVL